MKTSKPLLLTGAILLIAIFAVFATRYFMQSQSGGDYAKLSESISKSKQAKESITSSLASVAHPIFITDEFTTAYPKLVANLTESVASIDKNPVLTKDKTLKDTYDKYRGSLQSYIASNDKLVSSLKLYSTVSAACSDMSYNLDVVRDKGSPVTASVFSVNAKECQDAIAAGASAPDTQFNDQYFAAYLDAMNTLVESYKQDAKTSLSTAKATTDRAWGTIQSLNNNGLVLKRSSDPTEALDKLNEAIEQRKAALF